ncbi:MAG: tRNA (adenosine(37)-N6)-threonylcarbamoyltransferase complex transferase subunit TsaD [Bacteroidia bacterium]|nr:tRNA (adenosine(37)-N6)-threonylcarbamoyltransferase complex transferase subunit TsaD [Bacteroidia bacterium]
MKPVFILGIESSCDDTAAAVSVNDKILANVVAGQKVHEAFGGVVPELASRAHQQHIIPVVDQALRQANVSKKDLDAIAFTNGPGLLGALMVGSSFAKSFGLALGIPIIEVNHMQAHVLAHFARLPDIESRTPTFPFLCLTVSGGHTQLIIVREYNDFELIGQTQDDAAGEAFDKIAKIIGLPYPGGPVIDQLAKLGNPEAFRFPHPQVPNLDFSFSGLKTSILYFLNKRQQEDPAFTESHLNDICASVQATIVAILLRKLKLASEQTGIKTIAIAGGVSANSGLRSALLETAKENGWDLFIPPFQFCTDNAAMIAVAGYYKFLKGEFASQKTAPFARFAGL